MSTQDRQPESQPAQAGAEQSQKAVASRAKAAPKAPSASPSVDVSVVESTPQKAAAKPKTENKPKTEKKSNTAKSAGAKPKAVAAKKPVAAKPASNSKSTTGTKTTDAQTTAAKTPAAKPAVGSKSASAKSIPSTSVQNPESNLRLPAAAPDAEPQAQPGLSPQPATKARVAFPSSGLWPLIKRKAPLYWRLTRMHKPIGSLLLLWPTLWSLWLAAKGVPSLKNLAIFVLGVFVMRSAGCVINDFADRKIDGHVKRTQDRPLATGQVSAREAIALFLCLSLLAFGLVLLTNPLTIQLSLGGLLLAFCYPFMKRYTHLPQVVLGAAFGWGIPMAYAAENNSLPDTIWLVYIANLLWTVAYDTFYAMVDRDDDLKIGVKSTAILFGEQDRLITASLQALALYSLYTVGEEFTLGGFYNLGLIIAAGFCIYQQWLIRFRARDACFKAFLNNNWVGAAVFAGLALDLALK